MAGSTTFLQGCPSGLGNLVRAGEQSPVFPRSTLPAHCLLFLEMGEHGLLSVCSWRCFHHCCPRARSGGHEVPAQTGTAGEGQPRLQEQVGPSSGWKPWQLRGLVPLKSPPNTPFVYSFKCAFMEYIFLGPRTFSGSPLPTGF